MKKTFALIATIIMTITMTACSSGSTNNSETISQVVTSSETISSMASESDSASDKIIQHIKDTKDAWDKLVDTDLPALAKEKDKQKMVSKLTDTISWCDKESDYFLNASETNGLTDKQKQACLDIKTGLYGAESSCFNPMLQVFKGESDNVPDNYQRDLNTATDYITKAYKAVK